jgi:curved DNA-binding protein
LQVKIPAGSAEGAVIRLAGKKGEADLYLRIKFAPHARYSLSGSDLAVKLPVAPWEAALGAKVDLPLPDGSIKLSVPAGAQSGTRLRVKGRGFPLKTGGKGDVLVEVKIVVPTTLSADEREIFERLASVSSFNPRTAA